MKKSLFVLYLAVLPLFAIADTVEIDGIYYELNTWANYASVVAGANKYSGDIVIPQFVVYNENTYPIKAVNHQAFGDCATLKSVVFPKGITEFGSFVFNNCRNLETVVLPDSITQLWGTFSGCNKLAAVTIPETVTSIGSHTFANCSSLTELIIPKKVVSIGSSLFYGCKNLRHVDLPKSIKQIDNLTFFGCVNLEALVLPDSITFIGYEAFEGCEGLKELDIPNSVRFIDWAAFKGCSSLEAIHLPDSLTTIEKSLLYGCSALTSVTIPEKVISIGDYALSQCKSLKEIHIPIAVKEIAEYALGISRGAKIDVFVYSSIPPKIHEATFGSSIPIVYVPVGAKESYLNTDYWNEVNRLYEFSPLASKELITIKAKSYIREYGDENPDFEYAIEGQGLEGMPEIVCQATTKSDVGNYPIVLERGSILNPKVELQEGTLEIAKAPLTISVADIEITEGDEVPSQFMLNYVGWKNGEDANSTGSTVYAYTDATKNSSPGKYPIHITYLMGTDNYDVYAVEGTLSVKEDPNNLNSQIGTSVNWNGSMSQYSSPWGSGFSRGIDVKLRNFSDKDINIVQITVYQGSTVIGYLKEYAGILKGGETKEFDFSVTNPDNYPSVLPWLEISYDYMGKNYVKRTTDGVTGIDVRTIDSLNNHDSVYMLNGQKANSSLKKGIYIKGKKKMYMK